MQLIILAVLREVNQLSEYPLLLELYLGMSFIFVIVFYSKPYWLALYSKLYIWSLPPNGVVFPSIFLHGINILGFRPAALAHQTPPPWS
jgi:hypothetical protein